MEVYYIRKYICWNGDARDARVNAKKETRVIDLIISYNNVYFLDNKLFSILN